MNYFSLKETGVEFDPVYSTQTLKTLALTSSSLLDYADVTGLLCLQINVIKELAQYPTQ